MTRTDALTDLLAELRTRFAPDADVREVEVYLASRGYDALQIGEILAEFATHLEEDAAAAPTVGGRAPGTNAVADGPTFRVMGAYERSRFSPEAWGHLLRLVAGSTLSAVEREHVIERALMQSDGRIGLAELRTLLEGAGFDDNGTAGQTTVH